MVQKTAAVVILFQPEQSVEKNISSYIKFADKIYVYDNSEISNDTLLQSLLQYKNKITFIHDGNNDGIAKRLNQACDLAMQDDFDYLLTMDQDSYFDEASISRYFQWIENFDKNEKVAMFGVDYQHSAKKENCDFKKATSLITSGSVIYLPSFEAIGEFDENLFIDFVDVEYCFRSIARGYCLIEFPNIFLNHNLGELHEKRSLKNFKTSQRSFHSPLRLYYMTRNFLYMNSKYKKVFGAELLEFKKDIFNRIKNNLLYKPQRFKTINLLLKAYRDFKNGTMGKITG